MQPTDKKQLTDLVKNVEGLSKDLTKYIHDNDINNTKFDGDLGEIKTTLGKIELLIANSYVRREEFAPVQKIVYGLVSVILMGVMGAIIAVVLRVHP